MRYKNTKTGVVIDSPCVISGGHWVKVESKDEVFVDESLTVSGETDEEEISLESLSINELKEFAAENEINLGTASKKADIINIISASEKLSEE